HLLGQPDAPLASLAAPDEVVEVALLVQQTAQPVQLRDVGEEEYLPLWGAGVVLDLDLDDRLARSVTRQAGSDFLPPRVLRPEQRLDAAPGVARQPQPLRPREVEQRARVCAENAAG